MNISTSQNYIDMCCILVKYNILDAMLIWQNIGPTDDQLEGYINQVQINLEQESMMGVVNPLAVAAALTSES